MLQARIGFDLFQILRVGTSVYSAWFIVRIYLFCTEESVREFQSWQKINHIKCPQTLIISFENNDESNEDNQVLDDYRQMIEEADELK